VYKYRKKKFLPSSTGILNVCYQVQNLLNSSLQTENLFVREVRNAYRNLVGKPEGTRLLRRPRRRWEKNIRMGSVVGTGKHGTGPWVPKKAGKS
jgi:hypothetical protein